jgi:hypothetical protein
MSMLDTASYVLDTPGALLRGLLAGKPGSRATGREVLRLGENRPGFDSGDIPGFLAEMVLDPLTWIGGAGIAKGAKYLSGAAKARKAARVAKVADVAKAAESVANASKPLASVVSQPEDQLKSGLQWLSKHYGDKLAKTRTTTGQMNVVNPKSGLPLWTDGYKGADDLKRMAAGEVPVKKGDLPHMAWYDQADGRSIKYNPANVTNEESLKTLGIHEGMHNLNDLININPSLRKHIQRVNRAQERMWKRRGQTAPLNIAAKTPPGRKSWTEYIKDPDEVLARVAAVREGMESAGVKSLTPSTRIMHGGRKFDSSALELGDLARDSRYELDDLLKVYGPRLTNHLLRVLPVGAAVAGGGYAASTALSPRSASSA